MSKKRKREVEERDDYGESEDVKPLVKKKKKEKGGEEDVLALLDTYEEEEEPAGDDLMRTYESDLKSNPKLDRYDPEILDDKEYPTMDHSVRWKAEKIMADRDKASQPSRWLLSSSDDEEAPSDKTPNKSKSKRVLDPASDVFDAMSSDEEPVEEEGEPINVSERKGTLREWIARESVRNEIKRMFRHFLREFMVKGHARYVERIRNMCSENKESLEVSWADLYSAEPLLAEWVVDAPSEMLPLLDETAFSEVTHPGAFPDYGRIHEEIHVRITCLPLTESLRDLRQSHLNALIRVTGVVTKRTSVFPQIMTITYNCSKCGYSLGPFVQDNTPVEVKPTNCYQCQSKGPFILNTEKTKYRNFQKITLQESPGTVPAGRLPRSKDVILLNDLIDTVRPGDEVELTGIYKNSFDRTLNVAQGFPVFKTIIESNYIFKKEDIYDSFRLAEEDEGNILELAKNPNVGDMIIESIAPSIYGHTDIKTAIALSLFGGRPKYGPQKHKIRGDINLLLLGDPGTAKSQFLKYIEKTAYRAVYTTGRGASAVGLTAAVSRDPVTREWTLEGGALVLADKGVCMIDEFDKMNDQDRTSIHEAMEQQSISISKAGIVTSLQARCSVVAAANPIRGRYDSALPFTKNVDLTEAILSRFDVLCIVRDVIDPDEDARLARFVVRSHVRSHPEFKVEEGSSEEVMDSPVPQDLLRKYIMYARSKIQPKMDSKFNKEKVVKLFVQLRKETKTGGMPMTVRHLESIIRLAEASAKMHLRETVLDNDCNLAIRVTLNTFISSQKYAIAQQLRRTFNKYLIHKKDTNHLCLHTLQMLVNEQLTYEGHIERLPDEITIDCIDLESRVKEMDITDLQPFYNSVLFKENDFVLDSRKRKVTKIYKKQEL